METGDELSQAKAQVFEEIGRSVIAYQLVERFLKILLNRGRFSGKVEEIQSLQRKLAENSDKRTLGQAIADFFEHHVGPPTDAESGEPQRTDGSLWISFHVKFPLTESEQADLEKQLHAVVDQRNDLIHHSLDWMQLHDVAACHAVTARLRSQQPQLKALMDRIRLMVQTLYTAHDQLVDQLKQELERTKA